jgi:hypothetical protein
VAETVFDEPLHGVTAVFVEGDGGAEDPDNMAVITIMLEEVVEAVIRVGKRCFPCPAGAESEFVFTLSFLLKTVPIIIICL